MTFSGALTITDLDDFLTPSQACIIPVRNGKAQSDLPTGETEIQIDAANNYYEVSTYSTTAAGPGPSSLQNKEEKKKALEKAEINLNDCLACSGCITSTESLLITLQSQTEVLAYISGTSTAESSRTPILSIAPQTLASLSAAYAARRSLPSIPLLVLQRRIRHFLSARERGGWHVWDTTFARHLSLKETSRDFDERRAAARGEWMEKDGVPRPGPLPLLASACPGWVCYAEKAQGDLLPLLSSVRSSQAIGGALAKEWFTRRTGKSPRDVYHVTAMPCYDKKLEASRSDFYSAMHETRDVDCVLTTGELDLLLTELGFDAYAPSPLDAARPASLDSSAPISPLASPFPEMLEHQGTVSGSYLHTLLAHVASQTSVPTAVHTRKIRDSADNEEYILYDTATGEPLFKGAKVYGFRNLQNLVRKVGKETGLGKGKGAGKLAAAVAARRRKARTGAGEVQTPATPGTPGTPGHAAPGSALDVGEEMERLRKWDEKKLDFVEVMACPSGCVNGGGQMKPTGPVVDEEGYTRPMPDDGVAPAAAMGVESQAKPLGQESEEGWKWSTKEWVARVEDIYWNHTGVLTPPDSPDLDMDTDAGLMERRDEELRAGRDAAADALARVVVGEVVGDDEGKRWELLRTRFRKVEGDVLGGDAGGVTLEAVKW